LLQRHFARTKVTPKNLGGTKNANNGEDGQGERALDSSSPPLVPAHPSDSEAELVIATNGAENGARKRRRRPRTKKPPVDTSSSLQPDGVMEANFVADHERPLDAPAPAVVPDADHERTLDAPAPAVAPDADHERTLHAPAPAVVPDTDHERPLDARAPAFVANADADTEGWQDVPKKRHGGRTERAVQGLALEPTIAEQERGPKATVDEPGPVSVFDIVPTPNGPPSEWKVPKKPRARWTPVPPPPRLAPPTPPRPASTSARSARPRVAAHQVQPLILYDIFCSIFSTKLRVSCCGCYILASILSFHS
jgi:hypothetical protein